MTCGTRRGRWNVRARPSRARRAAEDAAQIDAVQRQRARVGALEAGDEIDQRRFSRAVRTDEAEDLLPRQLEPDMVDGRQAAEPLRQPGRDQHQARRRGTMPSSSFRPRARHAGDVAATMRTSTTPNTPSRDGPRKRSHSGRAVTTDRAEHRPRHRARAADHHHREEIDHPREAQQLGAHHAAIGAVHAPARPTNPPPAR